MTDRWRNNNSEGRAAGKIVKHAGGKGGNGSRVGFKAGMDRDEERELSSSSGTATAPAGTGHKTKDLGSKGTVSVSIHTLN